MGYRSFSQAMQARFGTKVYKLSLDGGMTCPNRDGTLGTRGCLFCGETGSGDFAAPHCGDIAAQLAQAKARISRKHHGEKYIAYFQSFTNTYAPVAYLNHLFTQAITPEEVVELLAHLHEKKPVWVELGLQTIHPSSAQYIRRGYALSVYDQAVRDLKATGLEVVTHVILGLPGESRQDMVETSRYVGDSGADGIKLQLLHVLEGTDLADDYRAGKVPVLSLEEYIAVLEDCLAVLPPEMVIHRLTGDGAKKNLLAPLWSANKKNVLNAIQAAFTRDNVQQGSRWQASHHNI